MRARAYVDGFSLYRGALRGTPFKWLNAVLLTEVVRILGYSAIRIRQ